MALDKTQVSQAIKHFTSDRINGSSWKRILFKAPAYAMERIAISMWHSVFGNQMTQAEKKEYRELREEIEATLGREDLEYLIKVMPSKQKEHYRTLLSLLPQENIQANGSTAYQQSAPQMSEKQAVA